MSMAMSDAHTSHADWLQYYQGSLAYHPHAADGSGGTRDPIGPGSPLAESTTVTATLTAASPAGAVGGGDAQSTPAEGRAVKAGRRRQRASRKAPTTLLNADAANFRAMVQQFTGAPPGTLQAGYQETAAARDGGRGPTALNFGLRGSLLAQLHPQQAAAFPFGLQHQQYPQYQQHDERPLITLGGGGAVGGGAGGGIFLQEFGRGNLQSEAMEVSEGYQLEALSSSHLLPRLLAKRDQ